MKARVADRPKLNDVARGILAAAGLTPAAIAEMDAPIRLSHLNESRFLTEFGVANLRTAGVPEALIQEMQDWCYEHNGVAPPSFVPVQPRGLRPATPPKPDRRREYEKKNPGKNAEYQRAYRARKRAEREA